MANSVLNALGAFLLNPFNKPKNKYPQYSYFTVVETAAQRDS